MDFPLDIISVCRYNKKRSDLYDDRQFAQEAEYDKIPIGS